MQWPKLVTESWVSRMLAENLTVIIVALLGGDALQGSIEAARAQCPNLLVVARDGTITDGAGKRIGAPEHCNIPFKRKCAVELAATSFVALIEDTVIPRPGWADAVSAALERPAAVACGGPVAISTQIPASSRALAFSEYGAFNADRVADTISALPGCNFAFRRDVLLEAMAEAGLVDQIAFERLQELGGQLVWAPEMAVEFCHTNDEGARLSTRFLHGRIYASSGDRRMSHRVLTAAKALLLPPVLTVRSLRQAAHAGPVSVPTLGWLLLQHTAWAAGELAGAAFGPSSRGLGEWQ